MANNLKIVHQLKYLTLKQERVKNDIQFNKRCLKEKVIPNYIQLRTKSTSQAALKTIEIAKKIWIREEIKFLYSKLNTTKGKIMELEKEMSNTFHPESIEEYHDYITKWCEPILQKKKETHNRKIDRLIKEQKHDNKENNDILIFGSKIENLTDIIFTPEEIEMLSKSIKYNVNLDHQQNVVEDQLIDLEASIRTKNQDDQKIIRHNFVHEVEKSGTEIKTKKKIENSKKDMRTIKSIASKLKENKAMITKADKSNTTVIIKNEYYNEKVEEFIKDNSFQNLTSDPTNEFNKQINNVITKSKIIPTNEKNKLKAIKPIAPTLRGLPKTHKINTPIRPVVNYRNAPAYKISKYLNEKLKSLLPEKENFSLSNSYELIENIKDVYIPINATFISFDVTSMYTKIPVEETLQILRNTLMKNKNLSLSQINDLISLTKTAVYQNYFEYNSKFYRQKDGLAMGSPLSGFLANIYLENLESTKIINNCNPLKDQIIYWYRYVDDILCLVNDSENTPNNLITYLNTISNTIKFTMEIQNTSINFLDLTITNENSKHSFNIYRKPSQSDLIIPANSNSPWQHKMATFHSLINRLNKVPMKTNDYEKEKRIIKNLATTNGYDTRIIEKMILKTRTNISQNKQPDTNKTEYLCVPYSSTLNKSIRKTFDRSNYKLSFRTRNNAFHLINNISKSNNKIIDCFERSGIYKIKCQDCEKFYIGQTGRTFKKRYAEHIQAVKSNNMTTQKSIFAEHILKSDHSYGNVKENIEILAFEKKGIKMNIKEELYIYKHTLKEKENILNTMQVQTKNTLFDKIIKIKENM